MKILVVSPSLPSPSLDMRGVHTNEQFRLLVEHGHEVRAIVPVSWAPPGVPRPSWQRRRQLPYIEHDNGVAIAHPRYLGLGPARRLPGGAVTQRALYWRALRPEIEQFVRSGGAIVHVHSCGLPGVVVDRVRPARSVVSMWDHELFDLAPAARGWERAIANSLRRADAVVYISDTLRKAGEALAGPHDARVIPLAIDEFADITPAPLPHFTVITAARLIERKHISLLIESFGRFLGEAPEARLTIVGDGPERTRLEQQAHRSGVAHAVEFTGRLPQRAVRERMAHAHLFVLPSVRESLGTVYFEAMSVKVPVVGARGEAIADYVTDGLDGFLIEPGDGAALVEIMRALHRDPSRRRLVGERGRAVFEEWDALAGLRGRALGAVRELAVTAYRPFDPKDAPALSTTGWDAWAEEYAELPRVNAAYRFSKRLLYQVVDAEIAGREGLDILDFNCGCGNDFAHFLDAGHRVVGCDGSSGMLRVAARNHERAVRSGAVSLFAGRAEHLSTESFGGRRFDLILSATGGTAYLDDDRLREIHRVFLSLMKPGGVMVVTHLAPRCVIESLWHLVHARPRAAFKRWRTRVSVTVRGEVMTMYLRSVSDLERHLAGVAPPDRVVPLNIVTPPFQAGIRLLDGLENLLYRSERFLQRFRPSLAVCDQVAWVARGRS